MDRGEEVDIELPNVVDVGEEDGVREPETKFSYGPYVVDYGTLVVVFLLSGVNRLFLTPRERYLVPGLQEASYPFDPQDTVPDWLLGVMCTIIPLVVFGAVFWVNRSIHHLHHAILGYLTALSFTILFTEVIKFSVGRYRPDYYGRLAADASESVIQTGKLSFPSGHSSTAFVCFIYISLYLSGQLRVFHSASGQIWKFVVTMVPVAIACWVAVTRLTDYRHHYSDVIGGALIGVGMAIPGYFLFFPSLFCNDPERAKVRYD